MIGARASWSIEIERETLHERGRVIAFERGGMPAIWQVLVLSDQGVLRSPNFERLSIAPDDGAERRAQEEQAYEGLNYLVAWVLEQYAPDEKVTDGIDVGVVVDRVIALLTRERALTAAELASVDTKAELVAANATIQALTELDATRQVEIKKLEALAAERAAAVTKLTGERDGLTEQVKRLAKAATKKTKNGPAGEETP